ncbi:MAG: hypothetical protein BMS9Abin08_0876 [Gammaproteobacteria bacterium]|nr:MAG: hypothetical protein BMS9Abin08_0876 [Gammaproteobacteria bacterium]
MGMKQDDDRIRDLYRQSASEQPPTHVDEAVLAASRKAVSTKCPRAPSRLLRSLTLLRSVAPFSGRWQLPASLAAVLIVTVLLVPLLQQESRDTEIPVPSAVVPRDTAVSAPPALMQREVAAPKKYKARLRTDAAPAREELEKMEEVLAEDALLTGSGRSAAVAEAPDQWLKRIEALVDSGDEKAAVSELQEFNLRYPEYPLPPGLEVLRDKE